MSERTGNKVSEYMAGRCAASEFIGLAFELEAENAELREALLTSKNYILLADEFCDPMISPDASKAIRCQLNLIDALLTKEAKP
jgi:hypothetical protein